MKISYLALTAALAASSLTAGAVEAKTLVATISGGYDTLAYDTPGLVINNTTSFNFTNVQMVLHGYQGDNNGVTETISLGDVTAGSTENVIWGTDPTAPGNLFANDYDDEEGDQTSNSACTVGPSLCAFTGNFSVTFTAQWNGTEISSFFTPASNATGGFVGWEGLDPSGLSETVYDAHSGGLTNDLANIYVGAPTVPEPATWTLMLAGVGAVGATLRKSRKRSTLQAVY